MASFCSNCGGSLTGAGAFCPHCGAPSGNFATAQQAPPQARSYAPPVAQSAGMSTGMKVVLVLLCLVVLGGAAIVGGIFYVAHRVKQAVVQEARENGVDLRSLNKSESDATDTRPLPKPCDLLSKEEVAQLIAEPIDHTETKDGKCEYYGPAGLSAKLADQEAANKTDHPKDSDDDAATNAIEAQRMLNRLGAQAGNPESGSTGSTGELPLIVIRLSNDGKSTMSALSLSKAIFGMANNAVARQQGEHVDERASRHSAEAFVGINIEGLGDKAMWTPHSGLYVLKADRLIQVDPGLMPELKPKAIALAKALLPKV